MAADQVEARFSQWCRVDFVVLLCAGPIPEALEALTKLMDLDLGNNQLKGKTS